MSSSSLTPSERSLRAQIGAHTKWARTSDRAQATAAARAVARTSLDQRLTADLGLTPESPGYEERIDHARRAHFARLALRSAQARRDLTP